ncbi:MAG: PEP-CTERM sorting domain-containing protein [Verrucomicrobiota bacterium]
MLSRRDLESAMHNVLRLLRNGAVICFVAGCLTGAFAQTNLTSTTYTQVFDIMGATGTTPPDGWFTGRKGTGTNGAFLAVSPLAISTGSSTTGTNYNFGSVGASTDRALGSLAASGENRVTEFRFTNGTGFTITALTIAYDGEQWRSGGASQVANALSLHYGTDGTTFTATGYNFVSPQVAQTAGALDGNATANRVAGIGGTITGLSIAPGSTVYLRWLDLDDGGTDAGIAIDNFNLTLTVVPEPSTLALVCKRRSKSVAGSRT